MKDKYDQTALDEIEVGTYKLNFSINKMIKDLEIKADLICSVLSKGNYKLIIRKEQQ